MLPKAKNPREAYRREIAVLECGPVWNLLQGWSSALLIARFPVQAEEAAKREW